MPSNKEWKKEWSQAYQSRLAQKGRRRINIDLSEKLIDELDRLAAREGLGSRGQVIERLYWELKATRVA